MGCKRRLKWDPSLPKIWSCMALKEKTSYLNLKKTVHNEVVLVNLNNLSSVLSKAIIYGQLLIRLHNR